MSKEDNRRGGIGFLGMLGILFIGLRLAGFIDWPWWVVLAPVWAPFALAALLLLVAAVIGLLEER